MIFEIMTSHIACTPHAHCKFVDSLGRISTLAKVLFRISTYKSHPVSLYVYRFVVVFNKVYNKECSRPFHNFGRHPGG